MSDFKAELKINELKLEHEWMEQPSLFMKWAELSATARFELDEAERDFELTCATIEQDIRTNPETFGLSKITENALLSAKIMTPQYNEALTKVNKARFNSAVLNSAVKAFDQRKDALENLVKLYGMNYYSNPDVKQPDSKILTKMSDRNLSELIKEKMNN